MDEPPDITTFDTEEPGTGRRLSMAFGYYAGEPTAALYVDSGDDPILLPMNYLVAAIAQSAGCEYQGCTSPAIGAFTDQGETLALCEVHAAEVVGDQFPPEIGEWIMTPGAGTLGPSPPI